jgi:pyruvate dehydrogenase E2 component (dihydrolipoamide acetyltransferase)
LSGGDQPAAAAAPAAKRSALEPEPETPVEEPAAEAGEEIPKPVAAPVASPSVRRLARELGIDLSKVRGSEAGGRIARGDLSAYIARLQKATEKGKSAAASAKPAAEQLIFPNGDR